MIEELQARLAQLQAKRAARQGKGGFKTNLAYLDEQIAKLEQLIREGHPSD